MKADVAFLPGEIEGQDLTQRICVVLDVFRATTSIVTGLINGCPAIWPVSSVEEAWELAEKKTNALMAGERQSIKIDRFDLGNSPREFSRERIAGRPIVMTTTNGTKAIRATAGAWRTIIGSFLNAGAVCHEILRSGQDVMIICAGTDGLFSLEDALCAGLLIERLQEGRTEQLVLNDAAQGARLLYRQARENLMVTAAQSRNGQRLCTLKLEQDVECCFRLDTVSQVPVYRDGEIVLLPG